MHPTLLEILCDTFNAAEQQFCDDLDIRDLDDWDSLTHMLFITNLEQKFTIRLSGDDIVAMRTIADIRRILKNQHDIAT